MRAHQQISEDLAQYALGELSGREATEIRDHIQECPECRRELQEINDGLGLLAMSTTASAPPVRARTRLLKAVAKEPHAKAVAIMRRPWWSFAPAFAAVLLAIIGLLLWRENAQLRSRLDGLRTQLQAQQSETQRAQAVLQTLNAPDAAHFTLVATPDMPPVPQGRAIYLRNRAALVFVANNLAPLATGKTYELWLLPESGSKPIPAGTFRPDPQGYAIVVMPELPPDVAAKNFAVTVENEGGSDTPTMPIVMAAQ